MISVESLVYTDAFRLGGKPAADAKTRGLPATARQLYKLMLQCYATVFVELNFYFTPKTTVFVIFPTFGQLQSRLKGINRCHSVISISGRSSWN